MRNIATSVNFSELGNFEPSDKGEEVEKIKGKMEVEMILNRLSPIEKLVVVLRMERVSFREIGKEIGKSESHSRKIKQLAKKKLRPYFN